MRVVFGIVTFQSISKNIAEIGLWMQLQESLHSGFEVLDGRIQGNHLSVALLDFQQHAFLAKVGVKGDQ